MPIMTFVNFMRWRLQLNENNVLFVKKGNSVFGVRKGEGRGECQLRKQLAGGEGRKYEVGADLTGSELDPSSPRGRKAC